MTTDKQIEYMEKEATCPIHHILREEMVGYQDGDNSPVYECPECMREMDNQEKYNDENICIVCLREKTACICDATLLDWSDRQINY